MNSFTLELPLSMAIGIYVIVLQENKQLAHLHIVDTGNSDNVCLLIKQISYMVAMVICRGFSNLRSDQTIRTDE